LQAASEKCQAAGGESHPSKNEGWRTRCSPTSPRKSLWHSLPRKSKKEFDSDDQTVHARFAVQHMSGICRTNFALWLAALLCLASSSLWAESGVLVVHVKDVQRHPISGVQIGVEGDGGSSITGDDGKARIRLAKQTREKGWVSLQILSSPPHRDFVMVSPWDYRTVVPSFENESENFVEVVVVQRGDRAALESGTVLAAATAQINKANAPETANKRALQEDPKANLAAVAKQYGLSPDDLDQAIRAWGAKTTDPYEVGLAALYQRNYAKASAQFSDSLRGREEKLEVDQKAVADAAFFLGSSLIEEGKYRESATALQRCLQLRPDDAIVLNYLEVSLTLAGYYAAAEPLSRRALAIDEKALGPDHPEVGTALGNLASLLQNKGDYAGAEPLFRRALDIYKKALGPDHPLVATALGNLALLLKDKGDYAGAESLFRQALAIDEKTLGPDHPGLAIDLGILAALLEHKGDYAGAEPLYRQALAIDEKALGPDHPSVARDMNNLAGSLWHKGDYAGAERLFRRALEIKQKVLGPDHPSVATGLNNLALLLESEGDYAGAEPLLRRSLAIDEKALGPDHPGLAIDLENLAALLVHKGDYAGAEPLFRRELTIDEKALGPNHPETERIRRNLQALIDKQSAKKTEK
jgi:tetratricopeptide (TPR) repeat protein